MENGYVESFNGRFRDECLNENWFSDLATQEKSPRKQDYNQARKQARLSQHGWFAKDAATTGCGKDGGAAALENASRFPLSPSLDATKRSLQV